MELKTLNVSVRGTGNTYADLATVTTVPSGKSYYIVESKNTFFITKTGRDEREFRAAYSAPGFRHNAVTQPSEGFFVGAGYHIKINHRNTNEVRSVIFKYFEFEGETLPSPSVPSYSRLYDRVGYTTSTPAGNVYYLRTDKTPVSYSFNGLIGNVDYFSINNNSLLGDDDLWDITVNLSEDSGQLISYDSVDIGFSDGTTFNMTAPEFIRFPSSNILVPSIVEVDVQAPQGFTVEERDLQSDTIVRALGSTSGSVLINQNGSPEALIYFDGTPVSGANFQESTFTVHTNSHVFAEGTADFGPFPYDNRISSANLGDVTIRLTRTRS